MVNLFNFRPLLKLKENGYNALSQYGNYTFILDFFLRYLKDTLL